MKDFPIDEQASSLQELDYSSQQIYSFRYLFKGPNDSANRLHSVLRNLS